MYHKDNTGTFYRHLHFICPHSLSLTSNYFNFNQIRQSMRHILYAICKLR